MLTGDLWYNVLIGKGDKNVNRREEKGLPKEVHG